MIVNSSLHTTSYRSHVAVYQRVVDGKKKVFEKKIWWFKRIGYLCTPVNGKQVLKNETLERLINSDGKSFRNYIWLFDIGLLPLHPDQKLGCEQSSDKGL